MKNTKNPLVSIVMPVYNAGEFLDEAIQSVVDQTYKNWELICINDGSTDNSLDILQDFTRKDPQIHVYSNPKNIGVALTANFGVQKAKGRYLAKMDADDIMVSNRLEKQVKFLKKHPSVVVVGGQCQLIDSKGNVFGKKEFPCDHIGIYKMAFESMPMQQPTMMINLDLIPKNFTWYQDRFKPADDLDVIFRLFNFGLLANLPDVLLKYRIHKRNISLVNPKRTFLLTCQIRKEAVELYNYQPEARAKIVNLVQFMVMKILPAQLVYPLYAYWRGSLSPVRILNRIGNFSISVSTKTQRLLKPVIASLELQNQ